MPRIARTRRSPAGAVTSTARSRRTTCVPSSVTPRRLEGVGLSRTGSGSPSEPRRTAITPLAVIYLGLAPTDRVQAASALARIEPGATVRMVVGRASVEEVGGLLCEQNVGSTAT